MAETKSILPKVNQLGFYEIRMEGIGGLGANLAGQMLAEAGILGMGLNGASFASYGSEKKGTPVKAYIRFCDENTEMRANSPVTDPHLLVIFHPNLICLFPLTLGVGPETIVVINTPFNASEMRDILELHGGTIGCVDALNISVQEKVRLNTPMMGAATRATGFLDPDAVKDVIRSTFEKRYPHLVEPNIRAFDRGYNEIIFETFRPDEKYPYLPYTMEAPRLGYENSPIGGIILNPGNTVMKDWSASRQGFIPVLDKDKCINCGQCEITCPDYCFIFVAEEDKKGRPVQVLARINLQYCKGCGKCVEVCPTDAITMEREPQYELLTSRMEKR